MALSLIENTFLLMMLRKKNAGRSYVSSLRATREVEKESPDDFKGFCLSRIRRLVLTESVEAGFMSPLRQVADFAAKMAQLN